MRVETPPLVCVTGLGLALEALLSRAGLKRGSGVADVDSEELRDFDKDFSVACSELQKDDGLDEEDVVLKSSSIEGLRDSLEGRLALELRERLRGDLLYLAVLRRFAAERIPILPSFECCPNKTWAMSGGAKQWRTLAGNTTFEAPLHPLMPAASSLARKAVLAEEVECGWLLDAYLIREVEALNRRPPSEDTPFARFLQHMKVALKQALYDVGGGSGLPDRNRTGKEAPAPIATGLEPGGETSMQQIALLGAVMENTRVAQADVYFGHVLFGLCLRRLARRFVLARNLGMLPPLSEAAQLRVDLEHMAAEEAHHGDVEKEQFFVDAAHFDSYTESMVGMLGGSDGGGGTAPLRRMLELSPALLAAARRHTDSFFGRGLREEIFKPMTRASQACATAGNAAARSEFTVAFMLEAASRGELRMLTAGLAARERLLWDAVVFGAFLEDAEGALRVPVAAAD